MVPEKAFFLKGKPQGGAALEAKETGSLLHRAIPPSWEAPVSRSPIVKENQIPVRWMLLTDNQRTNSLTEETYK